MEKSCWAYIYLTGKCVLVDSAPIETECVRNCFYSTSKNKFSVQFMFLALLDFLKENIEIKSYVISSLLITHIAKSQIMFKPLSERHFTLKRLNSGFY